MSDWFDPITEAKRLHDRAEADLEEHLRRGPWGTELLKLVTRYLGCVWQMEVNNGGDRSPVEGIKTAMDRLAALGSKCEPRRNKEEEEEYGD